MPRHATTPETSKVRSDVADLKARVDVLEARLAAAEKALADLPKGLKK